MKTSTPTAAEPGFIALCIELAHSTFSDVMPSHLDPKATGGSSRTKDGAATARPSWTQRLNDWFYKQQVDQREAYLAQATDIFDLERRIRHLERQPYY